MWVVKLGGSLVGCDALSEWIRILSEPGMPASVIVPGGGPWADAVRHAQRRIGFSESCAHLMALKAMEQCGLLLCDASERLRPCSSIPSIRAALERGRVPVWMPSAMVEHEPAIARSWDVTSDSLAAWLAGRIGATALVLVKSVELVDRPLSAMVDSGVFDPCFPQFLQDADCPAYVTGRSGCAEFRAARSGTGTPGLRLCADRATPGRLAGCAP